MKAGRARPQISVTYAPSVSHLCTKFLPFSRVCAFGVSKSAYQRIAREGVFFCCKRFTIDDTTHQYFFPCGLHAKEQGSSNGCSIRVRQNNNTRKPLVDCSQSGKFHPQNVEKKKLKVTSPIRTVPVLFLTHDGLLEASRFCSTKVKLFWAAKNMPKITCSEYDILVR